MFSFTLGVVVLLSLLSGCETVATRPAGYRGEISADAAVAAATFGPGDRLWRLIAAGGRLYVDASEDHGASFTRPVPLNADAERVLAQAEDRPVIAVDAQERVYVLYAVGTPDAATSYLSVSNTAGRSFQAPVPVSDPAKAGGHTQDAMVVARSGRIYAFWNDDVDMGSARAEKQGAGLYFATAVAPLAASLSNRKLTDGMCNCCRIAVDVGVDDLPVVFGRFVFPGSIRDHGMLKASPAGLVGPPWRVTEDDWRIEACPMHGPALSIAPDGRYHAVWFTQGRRRQGLFYAHSDDQGKHFSNPMAIGEARKLAQHADVLAAGTGVVLVWKEFDGRQTHILSMRSADGGDTWSAPSAIARTSSDSDYPFLIKDSSGIFLSWNNAEHGHQLITIR